ncbi:MAG: hypothetical protein R2864_11470 [Syntrophotaleaceae bacterium]
MQALCCGPLILAVALYPLQQRLAGWLGGGEDIAAMLVLAAGLLLIERADGDLGGSFTRHVHILCRL